MAEEKKAWDKEKEKDPKKLNAEKLENRVAPVTGSLDPSGDGITGKIKPRDR